MKTGVIVNVYTPENLNIFLDKFENTWSIMNIKRFLPFENYTLVTSLSPAEIYKRVCDHVELGRAGMFSFSNRQTTKPFKGQIFKSTFIISRVIKYRNSFLPRITGFVYLASNRTHIDVQIGLHPFVLVFMIFWFGTTGSACVAAILAGIFRFQKNSSAAAMLIIPAFMFFGGFSLMTFAFRSESKQAKDFLANIFEGQESTKG